MRLASIRLSVTEILLIFVVCLGLLLFSCAEPDIGGSDILAKVGTKEISVNDFKIAYELFPAFENRAATSIQQRKEIQIKTLIEKKLLFIAAEKQNIENDERVKILLSWYEKQAVIRQLYRTVVADQITITPDEMRTAYKKLNSRLLLRKLFFKSEKKAKQAYAAIEKGKSFENIARENSKSIEEYNYILTPKEFTWGELDERLEEPAYRLKAKEISPPIHAVSGYHLLQLIDKKEQMILTEYDYENRQHYIETIIRRRRETRIANAYARQIMENLQPHVNVDVLREMISSGEKAFVELNQKQVPFYLQASMIRPYMGDLKEKSIIEFKGGSWTVKQLLNKFNELHPNAQFNLMDIKSIPYHLSVMVRDEMLAQEAYSSGYAGYPEVRKEVARDREKILALYMRKSLTDTVNIDNGEIRTFYDSHHNKYAKPELVRVREIMVRKKALADSLHDSVEKGMELSIVAAAYSQRGWAAKNGGDLGYIKKGAFGEIGERAFEMNVGELSPVFPLKENSAITGFSFFRVLNKKEPENPEFQTIWEKVKHDVLAEKKEQVLNQFISVQKRKTEIYQNDELLSKIQTTDRLHPENAMRFVLKNQY
ncbi:MAG: peptidyl-prolyl cis-trans isomerase [Calditrichia bacterium]|nr:peptidyl-prolyl cis-trans isomerase [Calditrichia bacterium]